MLFFCLVFFFKQKTAYEMRISDWSSDVCSSDLLEARPVTTHRTSIPTLGAFLFLSAAAAAGAQTSGAPARATFPAPHLEADRKSVVSGKSVSERVDPGGRRLLKKKNKNRHSYTNPDEHNTYKKVKESTNN